MWPLDPRRFLRALALPVLALLSPRFYLAVLFSMRGVGFLYLSLLCVALSLPCALRVSSALSALAALELPRLVAQLPPSALNAQG
ncbi:MAG: hypothetical protein K6A65_03695, partial [Succinivibrionaceae bacterium]|nr:hypothetical protein [Succinivibrionaceae bacterium]